MMHDIIPKFNYSEDLHFLRYKYNAFKIDPFNIQFLKIGYRKNCNILRCKILFQIILYNKYLHLLRYKQDTSKIGFSQHVKVNIVSRQMSELSYATCVIRNRSVFTA